MGKQKKDRLYTRQRGGAARYYADFRDFSDVGGKQEALIAPGDTVATTDAVIAQKLLADRLAELQGRKRGKVLYGIERTTTLAEYAAYHLQEKARSSRVTDGWLENVERHLQEAVTYFGSGRDLSTISTREVQQYLAHLGRRVGGRGGGLISPGTQRQYLNSLSNVYRRAASEGYVQPGYNPVAALMDKPVARRREAEWLEVDQAALLLETARVYEPPADKHAIPFMHALLATFLLTGGRKSEVLGLQVEDVSFERGTVTFRPNEYRRLKTATSHRSVPLWPQLEAILRAHIQGGDSPRLSGLLFPSRTGGMIHDARKSLDAIAQAGGWRKGEIRIKMLRHTYCSARLQTLDHGAPVSPWTVSREMGHGGMTLVNRVYGHLGQVRQRSEHLEYRIENHTDRLRDRLQLVRTA